MRLSTAREQPVFVAERFHLDDEVARHFEAAQARRPPDLLQLRADQRLELRVLGRRSDQ
jgi:hypothetical protein